MYYPRVQDLKQLIVKQTLTINDLLTLKTVFCDLYFKCD